MAEPQNDEERPFTDQLREWAQDKEPTITRIAGIREYKTDRETDGIKEPLRRDVDSHCGTVDQVNIFLSALANIT
jgi:hypothetical protein